MLDATSEGIPTEASICMCHARQHTLPWQTHCRLRQPNLCHAWCPYASIVGTASAGLPFLLEALDPPQAKQVICCRTL